MGIACCANGQTGNKNGSVFLTTTRFNIIPCILCLLFIVLNLAVGFQSLSCSAVWLNLVVRYRITTYVNTLWNVEFGRNFFSYKIGRLYCVPFHLQLPWDDNNCLLV
jgi:hypothetical protein